MSLEIADWAKFEAALDELLALPASERPAALARLHAHDAALRGELESVLKHVDGEDSILDQPLFAPEDAARSTGGLPPGTRVGAYRLLCLIGRGGMGEVYRAERADGHYTQEVALKLIRHELADQPARFQLERQTLARLDHPAIARLLDGGVADDGRPFMVMELVPGSDLIAWCNEHGSSLDERLELFLTVCTAVEYAHRNLIVHRDLKPGNVIVTRDGSVKLLDFGIAKLLDDGAAQTRNAPMTPGYAAPEQLTQGAVTTATDVHALGMLLFELLTGERPWNFHELSLAAAIECVLRDPPPAPSAVAAARSDPPVAARLLRGDLDSIVAKALRKEPERRYESVAALRADIERSRRHQPVAAREGARLYAVTRFLRRYRTLAVSVLLTLIALVGGTAATLWQAHSARLEARRADAVRDFLLDIFQHNSVDNPEGPKARETTAEQLLDIGAERIRTGLKDEPQVRGEVMETLAELYDQLERFDKVEQLERERLAEIAAHGDTPSVQKATAQWHLGRTLVMQGDYPAADAQLKAAIATMDAVGDHESEQRAEALLEIGRIAYHRATPESLRSARAYAQESLGVYQANRNGRNPDRLFALQLLARVEERQGNLTDAERLYRAFLAQSQSPQIDANAPLRAHGHDDLGSLLLAERRYAEAKSELEQAIQLYSSSEGERQMDTAVDVAYLGQLLVAMNRGSEGRSKLEEALAVLAQTQGEDNLPTTAVIRFRFAKTELERGNLKRARALLDENIAHFEAKNPADKNYFPQSLRGRAEINLAEGRYSDAASDLERADRLWPIGDLNDGSTHGLDEVLRTRIAVRAGQCSDADRASLERLRTLWTETPERLPDVYVWATLALAEADLKCHREHEAELTARALLARILAAPEHEFLADWEARTRLILARSLQFGRQSGAARVELARAVELRERFDDPQSPWLAEARAALADVQGTP